MENKSILQSENLKQEIETAACRPEPAGTSFQDEALLEEVNAGFSDMAPNDSDSDHSLPEGQIIT